MLSFLTPHQPPRTRQSHLKTISTESGRTTVEFLPNIAIDNSPHLYATRTTVPPGHTIHNPPYHYHAQQSETFTIVSGTFLATVNGTTSSHTSGATITVPAGAYHTFTNPSPDQPLVILTALDPAERDRDEAFFRNLYGYLDDCEKVGRKPNLCQVMLFLWMFDCYVALPGGESWMWVMKPISELMVWVLGVVFGKWVMGFQESYPEYWDGDVEVLRAGKGKKDL